MDEVDSGNGALVQPRTICSKEHNYFKMQIIPSYALSNPATADIHRDLPHSGRLPSSPFVDFNAPSLSFFSASALVRLALISSRKPSWLEASAVTSQFKSADHMCVCVCVSTTMACRIETLPASCHLCITLASTVTTDWEKKIVEVIHVYGMVKNVSIKSVRLKRITKKLICFQPLVGQSGSG